MKLREIQRMITLIILLILITGGGFGCARMAVNMAGGPLISNIVDNIKSIESANLLIDGFAGDLVLITAITEMSPNNYDLLSECSFAYFAYALIKMEDNPEYAKELSAIGKEYGLRALKQNKKFAKELKAGKKINELVDNIGKKYTKALCWAGANGALLIILNMDDLSIGMQLADTIAIINRSVALDRTYFYGASMAILGAYYGIFPKWVVHEAGSENSQRMFNEARSVTDGKFLLVDLFEARYLAANVGDEELFEKRLKSILAADSSELEGAEAINELAKIKAKYYLDHQDEYF